MFQLLITVSILVWLMSSIVLATVFGAMFAPDKDRIVGRSIISFLLLLPCLAIVPLSFAASIILGAMLFIVGISIFGIRIALELIVDGIQEMDEDGNYIEKEEVIKPTAPWV